MAGRTANLRKAAVAVIGVALSAGGLAYVFRDILFGDVELAARTDEIFTSMRTRIEAGPLAVSVVSYWAGLVLLRSVLVRHLLAPVGRIRIGQAYRYICIGFLANNVLPFKAGEMARSAAVSRGTGISFASVVGGLALERMLDMAMVVVIAVAALRLAPLPEAVRNLALILGIGLGVGFLALFFLARRRWDGPSPADAGRVRLLLRDLWVRFSAGFGAMGNARGILTAAALSAAIWGVALFAVTTRLAAFGLPAEISTGLVLLTSLGFGVAVPSAPGYLGVYHAAVVFALEAVGVETSIAVSFGWFSWLMDMGISSLAGAVSLSVEGLKLGQLRGRPDAEGTAGR